MPLSITTKAYQGEFDVEPADFDLSAERFIVSVDGISFAFLGVEDDGPFKANGACHRQGAYFTPCNLYYEPDQVRGKFAVTVKIIEVRENKSGCHVSGEWCEHGETWTFNGTLIPFHSK